MDACTWACIGPFAPVEVEPHSLLWWFSRIDSTWRDRNKVLMPWIPYVSTMLFSRPSESIFSPYRIVDEQPKHLPLPLQWPHSCQCAWARALLDVSPLFFSRFPSHSYFRSSQQKSRGKRVAFLLVHSCNVSFAPDLFQAMRWPFPTRLFAPRTILLFGTILTFTCPFFQLTYLHMNSVEIVFWSREWQASCFLPTIRIISPRQSLAGIHMLCILGKVIMPNIYLYSSI